MLESLSPTGSWQKLEMVFFSQVTHLEVTGMKHCCLAADLGASSGRVMAATLDNHRIALEEIHRFNNSFSHTGGVDQWDVDRLFKNICTGISQAAHLNPESVGVDTWGVDYVLIDDSGQRIGPAAAYRDRRTQGMMDSFQGKVSADAIYQKTGIEFMELNTLYQLHALQTQSPDIPEKASHLLFSPDYYHYLLSGVVRTEQTIASTSQILNAHTGGWDHDLLSALGLSQKLFSRPIKAGTVIGRITPELGEQLNAHDLKVVAPAGHDTACAVAAIPKPEGNWAFLSSGTWSLMGVERKAPIINKSARLQNITNERGVEDSFRILKNMTGMWLIQSIQKEFETPLDIVELVEQAKAAPAFQSIINPNDPRFTSPDRMIESIQEFCRETGQPVPETPGALARCIFESVACSYRQVKLQLEELTHQSIDRLYLIGGGVKNHFLNQLTADACGVPVILGPSEASALGNALTQFMGLGYIRNLAEARIIVANSFPIQELEPAPHNTFDQAYKKFCQLAG